MKPLSWAWLFESQNPIARFIRLSGTGIALGVSAYWLIVLYASFLIPEELYRKDFLQEYLAGRAFFDGISPYLPLPELAARYMPPLPVPTLPHPTPHPPPILVFTLPFAMFSYLHAVLAWFMVEILCLIVWAGLMAHVLSAHQTQVKHIIFGVGLLFFWFPVVQDLIYGQLMIPLLLLLTASFIAWEAKAYTTSGIWLGLTLGIKPIFWPLLLGLAWRKAWRVCLSALVTAAGIWGLSGIIFGPQNILNYLLKISAAVSPYYQGFAFNFSLSTLGQRLFVGTGSPVIISLSAPPLFNLPRLAPWVSLGSQCLLLGIALYLQRQMDSPRVYLLWLPVSILLSPVAWRHYFVVILLPLVLMGQQLKLQDWPLRNTTIWLSFLIILGMPDFPLDWLIRTLAGTKALQVPAGLALLSWLPGVALLGLIVALRQLNWGFRETQSHQVS